MKENSSSESSAKESLPSYNSDDDYLNELDWDILFMIINDVHVVVLASWEQDPQPNQGTYARLFQQILLWMNRYNPL